MPAKSATAGHVVWRAAQRWGTSAVLVVTALIWLVDGGPEWSTVVGAAVLVAFAWLFSPWFFPRSHPDASAQEEARAAGVPAIYYRPGCVYCLRLRLALGRRGSQALWVDVSGDDDASARVRSVTGGDETVPTVFVDGSAAVNPAPDWVRSHLAAGRR